jgi:hypothetical protein
MLLQLVNTVASLTKHGTLLLGPLPAQSTSVEDMDKRLAALNDAGKIDPAFLHITARAYGNAKDRTLNEDEVCAASSSKMSLLYELYVCAVSLVLHVPLQAHGNVKARTLNRG